MRKFKDLAKEIREKDFEPLKSCKRAYDDNLGQNLNQ